MSFVLLYINFLGLFNAESIFVEEHLDKMVHIFLQGISSKVNVIARLVIDDVTI